MNPENSNKNILSTGWIEVITGCMFSGKTEEFIRRLKRAIIAKQKVEIFKAGLDKRYSEDDVVSHDSNSIKSTPVEHSSNILMLCGDARVVGIDEAQFFDLGLVEVCNILANRGVRVIVAGLDVDFRGKPFGPIPSLLASAEYVTKVHAICVRCGDIAHYSYRTTVSEKLVVIGAHEVYEPLCRKCFNQSVTDNKNKNSIV
jgi:thymidine kinase